MAPKIRPETPVFSGVTYAAGALALLLINAVLLGSLITGPANSFAAAIVMVNLVAFAVRGAYAGRHWRSLFNEGAYRAADEATGTERVGLFVFIVVLLAKQTEQAAEIFGWAMDASLGELGQMVMLLAVTAPTATYLTADHGKLRRIVREQAQLSSVGPATSSDRLT